MDLLQRFRNLKNKDGKSLYDIELEEMKETGFCYLVLADYGEDPCPFKFKTAREATEQTSILMMDSSLVDCPVFVAVNFQELILYYQPNLKVRLNNQNFQWISYMTVDFTGFPNESNSSFEEKVEPVKVDEEETNIKGSLSKYARHLKVKHSDLIKRMKEKKHKFVVIKFSAKDIPEIVDTFKDFDDVIDWEDTAEAMKYSKYETHKLIASTSTFELECIDDD